MRHNPNRDRPEFKRPLAVRVYAWALLAMAPILAALFGWPAGALAMAAAYALDRWPAIRPYLLKKESIR